MRITKYLTPHERLMTATKAVSFLVAGWLIGGYGDFDGSEIFALAAFGIGVLGLIYAALGIQRMT